MSEAGLVCVCVGCCCWEQGLEERMQCHAPLLEELVKYFPQPSYVLRTLEQGLVVCVLGWV